MKKDNLIPKRRFKEFKRDGAWEQRKFSELVNRISMSSESKMLPRVEYEDIISGQGILNKDLYLKENNKKGNEFKENDILFGYLRPYLDNRLLASFNGIAVGDWWVLRSQNCNVNFIYSLIQTQKFQGIANLSTGTKMPRANWSTVASAEYLVPYNIKEQKKIGEFLFNLDNLITLHQRKLKKYQNIKLAYLSEMFPQNGERYPRRRFAGFTDPWEQRKLGEVTEKITKGTTPLDKNWIGPVNYIKTESIDKESGNLTRTSSTSLEEHEGFLKRSQLKNNDLLFSIVGTLGRVGIVKTKHLPANTNQQIAIIRLKAVNPNFVMNALKSPSIKSFISSETTIGAQPSLSLWQIDKMEIAIPRIDEQEKIGTFFSNLDNLITLHQRM